MFRQSGTLLTSVGVTMPAYDAFTLALSGGDTTETYKFYKHGTSGTQVAQWVLVYTDDTRETLVSGVFTDLSAS